MPKYSTGLLNEFAPHLTELTECNLPSMDGHKNIHRALVHSFILNSTFCAKYPDPQHQYALVFLRKTESAFYEYYSAYELLNLYVNTQILHSDKPEEQISRYFEILHKFEVLISQIMQAYMVLEKFLVLDKHSFWSRGDGSVLDKLYTFYNFTKHAEDKINEIIISPGYHIWLTNSGISCRQEHILYTEISEVLKELAENAIYYGNPSKVISDIQKGTYPS